MKLLKFVLLCAALLSPACDCHARRGSSTAEKARVDEIQLTMGGKYKGAVPLLLRGEQAYLHARTVFTLTGAVVTWKEKSQKLLARNKTGSMEFEADKKSYQLDSSRRPLSRGAVFYNGMLYLPVDFFTSVDFAEFCGEEAVYNERAHSLDLGSMVKVGEVDFFSYRDTTRISIELDGTAKYRADEKNSKHIDIFIPEATAQTAEMLKISDGIVKTVNVSEDDGGVRISVVLDNSAGQWKVQHEGGSLVFEASASGTSLDEISKTAEKRKAEDKKKAAVSGASLPSEQQGGLEEIGSVEPVRVSSAVSAPKKGGKKLVVIDAGHGGKDPGGTRKKGMTEKALNLAIARELEKFLAEDAAFEVLMTRTSDYFVPLGRRSEISNNAHADLFVSIHANASRSKKDNGFEIYYMSETASDPWAAEVAVFENSVLAWEAAPSDDTATLLLRSLARNEYLNEGSRLAGLVAKHVTRDSTGITNRGARQAPFYVLRGTYAPAVLVEAGFMTNASDATQLNDRKVHKNMARGIYKAIEEYARLRGWK